MFEIGGEESFEGVSGRFFKTNVVWNGGKVELERFGERERKAQKGGEGLSTFEKTHKARSGIENTANHNTKSQYQPQHLRKAQLEFQMNFEGIVQIFLAIVRY